VSARRYLLEQVGEAAIVQLYADGFDALPVRQKVLVWHLTRAALAGRDIYYDQRHRHNLQMRAVLEAVLTHAEGIDADVREAVTRYTKLFWLNSGPYNNLTARKFVLPLSAAALTHAVATAHRNGARLPLHPGETPEALVTRLGPMFLDATVDPMVTSKTPGPGHDVLTASANNLYDGVAMTDLDTFRERHPLNSRLVKRDGSLHEEVYRIGGLYHDHIVRIVGHLRDAAALAPEGLRRALEALIRFYETGEDADREAFDIAWVTNPDTDVDTMNGFIEVYMDARGIKGAWEGLVYYTNHEKTGKIQRLAADAQWFEDHMPYAAEYRKPVVTGITAQAIEVVMEAGDSGPITPIGVNLPNDQRIREVYGSRSVSLSNVMEAYDRSQLPSMRHEFCWDADEEARAEQWAGPAGELATDIHEVLGHGSGRMAAGVTRPPQDLLKEQYSTLEETRADLVALYFIADPRVVEIGLVEPGTHADLVRAEYEAYARTALVQLRRIREGTTIEEDHMRNRQAIVHWLMAHTRAIETRVRDGRTYYVVCDVGAFRDGVARMLHEVQRIKSEGDYAAARALFEAYGTHFEATLRDEVVARVDRLGLPSYTGFVMPTLTPMRDASGAVCDVTISYSCDFMAQMLEYSGAQV